MELGGRTVLVVGAARTGVAVARCLDTRGARVRLADRRAEAATADGVATLGRGVECHFGAAEPEGLLAGVDLVVPSPGVPATTAVLRAAVARGVPVLSEIEVAARLLSCPIVAITGTNGKSTTTSLVGEMLAATGARVFVGGNLGTPLIQAVAEAAWDVAVAEVSSFQLEWVERFRPAIAACLNVTPDHLDRHGSMAAYVATKARLFAAQRETDVAVLNRDDATAWGLVDGLRARLVSFGMADPRPGPGVWATADAIVCGNEDGAETRFVLTHTALRGQHNLENMMAAVAVARAWGVDPPTIQRVLDRFRGLPHRCEFVAEIDGVRYYDDSKATNVGAAVKSLAGFAEPVVLLAGGLDKGTPFEPLRPLVGERVRHVVAYGAAAGQIAAALRGAAPVACVERFADAVEAARAAAQAGDVVLLAPGCASFDQFRDYAERGATFRALVVGAAAGTGGAPARAGGGRR